MARRGEAGNLRTKAATRCEPSGADGSGRGTARLGVAWRGSSGQGKETPSESRKPGATPGMGATRYGARSEETMKVARHTTNTHGTHAAMRDRAAA